MLLITQRFIARAKKKKRLQAYARSHMLGNDGAQIQLYCCLLISSKIKST